MHAALVRELAREAIADTYSCRPLEDRVAAAIVAALEMEAEETCPTPPTPSATR